MAAPKQRKGGQFGGSGHKGSMWSSTLRGGKPRTGGAGGGKTPNSPGGGCVALLGFVIVLTLSVATYQLIF